MYILVSAFLIAGAFMIASSATASASPISPWLARIGQIPKTATPVPSTRFIVSPIIR